MPQKSYLVPRLLNFPKLRHRAWPNSWEFHHSSKTFQDNFSCFVVGPWDQGRFWNPKLWGYAWRHHRSANTDTACVNSALSACARAKQWEAGRAMCIAWYPFLHVCDLTCCLSEWCSVLLKGDLDYIKWGSWCKQQQELRMCHNMAWLGSGSFKFFPFFGAPKMDGSAPDFLGE